MSDLPNIFNPGRFVGAVLYSADGTTPIDTPTGDSEDTALAVHIEHLHQRPWLHPFHTNGGASTTLNGAVAADTRVLEFTDASGFTVGDEISLSLGVVHTHMYRTITVIATNTVTINAGLDIPLTDGSNITEVTINMAVNGAITPVIYSAQPAPTEKVDIMRLLFSITDATEPDDSKFGGIAALTNGVHIRRNIDNTTYQTLTVWKTNKDMKLDMYNVDYAQKAGGGNWGVNGRWSIFDGTGSVVNVDSNNNETIECIIQDDLTGLITFEMRGQGHIEV